MENDDLSLAPFGSDDEVIDQPVVVETPAAETVQPPATETPAAPAPGPNAAFVPLSAVLDEREKRQALEKRLAELERATPAQAVPDITSDPRGWQAANEARLAQAELNMKMELSGRFAASQHGADKIEAAKAWGMQQAQQDQFFGTKFTQQQDPFGWLVEQHRQAQAIGTLGNKTPEQWAIEYAASLGYVKPGAEATQQQPAATQVAVQPAAQASPSRSIANAGTAGGISSQPALAEKDLGFF